MSGTVQDFLASIALMLGPIAVFGIYKLRRYSREIQRAERDALPYDPKPRTQAGVLLHRFSAPEQKYLQQTLASARYGFMALSWLTFGIFSLPIFDPWVFNHNSWNNPRVFLWFRTLLGAATFVGTNCFLFGIVTAALVVSALRFGMTARFFRTRPLGIGFLFWTNLVVALGSELAAILTGAGTAILLLAAIHGPIWLHLPPAFPGLVTPNNGKQELYASLLATSPPRVLLSVCTTITLSLSVFSVLLAIPYSWRGKLSSGPNIFPILAMGLGMCGLMVLNLALDLNDMHLPTWLFVYSELGPPPPYPFALIAIAISACLLCVARYFVGKSEV